LTYQLVDILYGIYWQDIFHIGSTIHCITYNMKAFTYKKLFNALMFCKTVIIWD